MKNTWVALFFAITAFVSIPISAKANSGDFDGGVAIGSSYAGVDTAPTNGAIIQGDVGIGTTSPDQTLTVVGTVHSTTGGVEFPDGTTQTTAASSGSSLPSGSVIMWATDTPPTGYLECDGSAVSRTTYAALFSAIGTTFGSGDGSTTFNLPDIRGQFVRGWDDGAGIDTGRTFGSTQAPTGIASANTASNSNGAQVNTDGAAVTGGGYSIWNGSPFTSSSSYFTTRPTNIALMFCIKY